MFLSVTNVDFFLIIFFSSSSFELKTWVFNNFLISSFSKILEAIFFSIDGISTNVSNTISTSSPNMMDIEM